MLHARTFGRTVGLVVSVTILLAVLVPPPVGAAGVVGTGTPASCTEAAFNAALAGGGTITFDCGPAPHTIPITLQKTIYANTTIDGGGLITLDGQGAHRLFEVAAELFVDREVTLRNLVLTRGYVNGDGGAIRNYETLVLEHTTIRDSRATLSGGAIVSYGPLTIRNSLLEGNEAVNGGAVYPRFAGARTLIVGSTLRNNHARGEYPEGLGGAILAWDGAPVTLDGSDIAGNTAVLGGGIYNFANSVLVLQGGTRVRDNAAHHGGGLFNNGMATLTNVTLSNNQVNRDGGGLFNDGTATLTDVTLRGNTAGSAGGGLFNMYRTTLTNVAVTSNAARFGGGLFNEYGGTATLTNVTLSGNTASDVGGGIYNKSDAMLTNVTLSGNSAAVRGGGIYSQLGTVEVRNTIVANSPSGGNCAGTITDRGFNLASDTSCGCTHQPNLRLSPLADNGGPTQTHLPQAGSPAIDFVATNCPQPATDQRGARRPVDGDGDGIARCDAGAVEYGAAVAVGYLPLLLK